MDLQTPLSKLKGVGSNVSRRLERLGLVSVFDLLYHFPFRYEDFSVISKISQAPLDQLVTVQGEVWSIKNIYTRYGKILTQALLNDSSASLNLTWFNQPWLTKNIKVGDKLQICGKVTRKGSTLSIVSPQWEKQSEVQTGIHTGRLVPVYPETSGLTSKWFRQKMSLLMPLFLSSLADPLPDQIRDGMVNLAQAIYKIHFPSNLNEVAKATRRLSFDELFEIQLVTQKIRLDWQKKEEAKPIKSTPLLLKQFLGHLPFTLTDDQQKVLAEITRDISDTKPMNRLLQGEVGSGKTVVAAAAAYLTFKAGLKSLLMAPTEILAFQHFQTFVRFLEPLGISIALYTGSKKSKKSADVTVGTHAILSEKLLKDNIGLVIIDEQQRFGVAQRSLLRSGAPSGKIPHFLTMTATPIPRTVALTLYGDLDLSTIATLPAGRQKIRTHVVPSFKRNDAYRFIEKKVTQGEQAYIVTLLIEASETLISARAAKVEFETLKKVFPKLKLGLLHGKLKSKEKEEVINQFRDRKIDILVSTSVVEVGVDIPNATIMVIEGAERFGLAQLHQLRGRVGRGEKESFCLLFAAEEDSSSLGRLRNLEKTQNGLELSEIDLKIRGSGQVFGTKQSGRWDLKIAKLSDFELVQKAKEAARQILAEDPNLDKYPLLAGKLADLTGIRPD